MSDTNLSAVLYKKGDLRLEDRGIPEPGPGGNYNVQKTIYWWPSAVVCSMVGLLSL